MKVFHRTIAVIFILAILGLAVYHVVTPDLAYSAGEKRALEQMPEFSLDSVTSGRFMERAEDYLQDQFPLRAQAMTLKTGTQLLLGKRESQGVYYSGDDRLMERFDGMDPENYAETVAAIKSFAERNPGPEYYFLMAPNAVWRYPELLPAGAETEDQGAFIDAFFTEIGGVMTPVDGIPCPQSFGRSLLPHGPSLDDGRGVSRSEEGLRRDQSAGQGRCGGGLGMELQAPRAS